MAKPKIKPEIRNKALMIFAGPMALLLLLIVFKPPLWVLLIACWIALVVSGYSAIRFIKKHQPELFEPNKGAKKS